MRKSFVANDDLLLTVLKTLEKCKVNSPLQKVFDVFGLYLGAEECRS